ncbi:MAG: YfhO family protein [Actinomycetota bacterium]|nr:YfhO family protein [Actinomycetota bacterium]
MRGKSDLPALFFLLILNVIFFWKATFLGKVILPADVLLLFSPWKYYAHNISVWNIILSDPVREFYPWKAFLINSLKSGALPLWNPYILSGTPFISNIQAALFYPFNVIFYLFSPKYGYGYYIMLHYFLAGVFMYYFGRTISLNRAGALVAAVVFTFNKFTINWSQQIPVLSVIIWIPLVFLFLEKMISKRLWIYVLLTAIVLSIQILGGNIQFSFYIFLAAGLYFLFRLFLVWLDDRNFRKSIKLCGCMAVALTTSLALSAVQLVPTFALLPLIVRRGDPYELIITGAYRFWYLITFLVPHYFGDPVRNFAWVNVPVDSGYVGILPLLLALAAFFFFRKDKFVIFFSGLAVLSLLLALGTPLYKLFYYLPLAKTLRCPSRFLFLYVFSLSVLSGLGMHYLTNSFSESRSKKMLYFLAVATICAGLLIFSTLPAVIKYKASAIYLAREVGLFLLFFSASVILLTLLLRKKINVSIFKVLALGLIVLDIFLFGMSFLSYVGPKIVYFDTPSINFLRKDPELFRVVRFGHEGLFSPLTPNTGMIYGLFDVQGSDVFILNRYAEFVNLIEDHGKYAIFNEIPNFISVDSLNSKLLDLLNAKYILSSEEIQSLSSWKVFDKDMKIYKNPNYLPRAFLIHRWEVLKGKKEIFGKLKSENFDPRHVAVLEKIPSLPKKDEVLSGPVGRDYVRITVYEPNEIKLLVNSRGRCLLLLSEVFCSGWKAYVDGKETEILRANYILRSIPLSSGSHKIQLVYRPRSFWLGKLVSGIAASVVFFQILALNFHKIIGKRR